MRTDLDRLLDSIHPSHTVDEMERQADEALISFQVANATITDWNEFRACLGRFLRQLETHVLNLRGYPETSLDFQWGRCLQLLEREYGPGGKAAFELARTGNEGGLYSVLKTLAAAVVKQYSGDGIRGRILRFWNSLSADEKLAVTSEYLAKYGHLLPSELIEGSAGRVRAEFLKVLEQHPELLRQLGRVGNR